MKNKNPFWRNNNRVVVYKLASQKIWSLMKSDFKKALKLDWNEGDNYMVKNVKNDLINFINLDCLNYYPNTYYDELYNKIALFNNCKKENILLTAGSDAASDLIIKTLINPISDKVLICGPVYDNFRVMLSQQNISYEIFDFFNNGYKNFGEISQDFSIVYLVRPNNPTGQIIDKQFLLKIIKTCPNTLFIVDEAYIEFNFDQSLTNEIENFDNIIITRTFSKAFGLAGFRVGYTLSNTNITSKLTKFHNFKSVNSLALVAAISSLKKTNIIKLKNYVNKIDEEKVLLVEFLNSLEYILDAYSSSGNFIFTKFLSKKDKISFISILEKNLIYVRDYSHIDGYEKFCRISVNLGSTKRIKKILKLYKSTYA